MNYSNRHVRIRRSPSCSLDSQRSSTCSTASASDFWSIQKYRKTLTFSGPKHTRQDLSIEFQWIKKTKSNKSSWCLNFTLAYLRTKPDVKLIIPSLVDLLEDFVEVLLRLAQKNWRKLWVRPVQPGPWKFVLRFNPMKTYKLAIRKHQFWISVLWFWISFATVWIHESVQNHHFYILQMADPPLPWGCHIHPQGKEIWVPASFTKQFLSFWTFQHQPPQPSTASGLFLLPCHGIFVAGHHLLELPLAGHRTHRVAHLGRQLQAWGEERQAAGNALAPLREVPQSGSWLRNLSKIGKNMAMLLGKKDEPLDEHRKLLGKLMIDHDGPLDFGGIYTPSSDEPTWRGLRNWFSAVTTRAHAGRQAKLLGCYSEPAGCVILWQDGFCLSQELLPKWKSSLSIFMSFPLSLRRWPRKSSLDLLVGHLVAEHEPEKTTF